MSSVTVMQQATGLQAYKAHQAYAAEGGVREGA